MGCSKPILREKFIATQSYLRKQENPLLPQTQSNFISKGTRKKPKVSRKIEIIKIREEINKIETKKL